MPKKSEQLDYTNLYNSFSSDLEDKLSIGDETYNIIEFVEKEVDLGIELTPQQKTVLKAFYNLPLTEEEESIAEFWVARKKSTWSSDDRYQSLVLESGRRCIAGHTLIDTDKGYKTIKELCPYKLPKGGDTEKINFKVYVAEVGYVKPKNIFRLGYIDTLIIKTKEGYSIEVTKDHKLFQYTFAGEKKTKAKDLVIGDFLVVLDSNKNICQDCIVSINPSRSDCYDFEIPVYHHYVANSIKSSNSGKTTIAAIIASYELYCLCRLGTPQLHYGIATSTPISILVIATTATQAKKTIFKTVTGVVNNTRYFKKLISQGKIFVGKEEISYEEKLLYIYSGNSQSGSQVGGTMKALIMDEVARFKDVDGASNALELWSNLGIATTTFGKDARRIAISSAWYEGDAIQQLYNSSACDVTSLGIQTASWDLNPIHAAIDNPIVASEYATNPAKAALEFEGVRPAAVDAFLDQEEVKKAFTGKTEIIFTELQEDEAGFLLQKINIESCISRPSGTILHIDPAITNDSYALGFGHNEFIDDRQVVVIAGLLSWEPQHNTQVSITDVQKAILYINKYRPLEKVSADHYNSAETLQRLRMHGIKCESQHYSNKLQVAMYDLVRVLLHEGRLILPGNSPLTPKLLAELSRVQLIRGQKIDHPAGFSKDLADCVASICWNLADRIQRDKSGNVGISSSSFNKPYTPGIELNIGGRAYSNVGSSSKQKILGSLQGRNKWFSGR